MDIDVVMSTAAQVVASIPVAEKAAASLVFVKGAAGGRCQLEVKRYGVES